MFTCFEESWSRLATWNHARKFGAWVSGFISTAIPTPSPQLMLLIQSGFHPIKWNIFNNFFQNCSLSTFVLKKIIKWLHTYLLKKKKRDSVLITLTKDSSLSFVNKKVIFRLKNLNNNLYTLICQFVKFLLDNKINYFILLVYKNYSYKKINIKIILFL